MQGCATCASPHREGIDYYLGTGRSALWVSRHFPGAGYGSVRRHRAAGHVAWVPTPQPEAPREDPRERDAAQRWVGWLHALLAERTGLSLRDVAEHQADEHDDAGCGPCADLDAAYPPRAELLTRLEEERLALGLPPDEEVAS